MFVCCLLGDVCVLSAWLAIPPGRLLKIIGLFCRI